MDIRTLVADKNLTALEARLSRDSALASEPVSYDTDNNATASPLHRICDAVHMGLCTDDEAVEMAKIFIRHGADINGGELIRKKDTPLIAAASSLAQSVGLLYVSHGANIHHAGCHGGTALHWAAWTGSDRLLQSLIAAGAALNQRCIDFQATPLFWALHGYQHKGGGSQSSYVDCVRLLMNAGADVRVPNVDGTSPSAMVDKNDGELFNLLHPGNV